MAFWSDNTLEPLRKFRFRVQLKGKTYWWAKSVTQPSPEVSMNEYQLVNHKIKFPGIVTWNDVDITIVDVGKKGLNLYKDLKASGYSFNGGQDGLVKDPFKGKTAIIEKLDSGGKTIETWTLYNPFIKGIKYGDLDYSADDLLEITLTLAYDSAELAKGQVSQASLAPRGNVADGAAPAGNVEVGEGELQEKEEDEDK